MADIFISYARADRDRIEKLAAALEMQGYSVWWDRRIQSGSEFSKDIEAELEAAKAVVVCWSRHANASRWVKDEANAAAEAGKLLTVTLDGEMPPIGFRQFHCADLSGWRGDPDEVVFQEFNAAVKARVSGEAPAASRIATKSGAKARSGRGLPPAVFIVAIVAAAIVAIIALGLSRKKADPPPDPSQVSDSGAAATIAANTSPHPEALGGSQSSKGLTGVGPRSTGETQTYRSIAVLAFSDLSPEHDQEYFSDGIAEELLNVLARETDLRVAARTSSFAFKGKDESIAAIAKALNVDAVLEGSVRKAGDKIRITAQLIDARSGFHLWSETYDRELSDVFAVQDEIASAIVRSLPGSTSQGAIANVATTDSVTYDLFLQARHQLERRTKESIEKARSLLEQAVGRDPDYAPAWADLALTALLLLDAPNTYGDLSLEESVAIAAPAVATALKLNPMLSEAHVARGLLSGHQGNTAGWIEGYRKAIELNPNVSNARHLLYIALTIAGDYKEAFDVIDQAVEIDPLSAITLENHVDSLLKRGRFEDAFAAARRLVELHPDLPISLLALSRTYIQSGQVAEGLRIVDEAPNAQTAQYLNSRMAFAFLTLKLFDHPSQQSGDPILTAISAVLQGRDDEAREKAAALPAQIAYASFAYGVAAWVLWTAGDGEAAYELIQSYPEREEAEARAWIYDAPACYPGLIVAGLHQKFGDAAAAAPIIKACGEILDRADAQGYVPDDGNTDTRALLLVLEGRNDEALAELRAAADTGRFFKWWIGRDPLYAPLHDDPQFIKIVADVNTRADAEREKYMAMVAAESEGQ